MDLRADHTPKFHCCYWFISEAVYIDFLLLHAPWMFATVQHLDCVCARINVQLSYASDDDNDDSVQVDK